MMHKFKATIDIIGINPFVYVPERILKEIFEGLSASRQKEIVRYISNLKSDESVTKNVQKAIGFLTGKNRFVGRDNPST